MSIVFLYLALAPLLRVYKVVGTEGERITDSGLRAISSRTPGSVHLGSGSTLQRVRIGVMSPALKATFDRALVPRALWPGVSFRVSVPGEMLRRYTLNNGG